MKPRLILSALIIVFACVQCLPAQASGQLSPKEEREARRAAHQFSQRLLQTKDIGPLIREFFVPRFIDGYLQDPEENFFVFNHKDKLKFSRPDLERFYVAQTNWLYLCDLYVFSKHSPSEDLQDLDEEATIRRLYPADVLAIILSNPYFNPRTIETTNEDALSALITKDVAHLRSVTKDYARAGTLLRRHANSIGAGHTRQYQQTIADWSARFHYYKPWLRVCEERCLGLPKGTRLIRVNVPSLQLELTNIDGRLKIVKAVGYVD